MTIIAVIGFCIVLLVIAFLAPRLSRHFQKAGDKPLQLGQRGASSAPGKLGQWLSKPFGKSRKAVSKAAPKDARAGQRPPSRPPARD